MRIVSLWLLAGLSSPYTVHWTARSPHDKGRKKSCDCLRLTTTSPIVHSWAIQGVITKAPDWIKCHSNRIVGERERERRIGWAFFMLNGTNRQGSRWTGRSLLSGLGGHVSCQLHACSCKTSRFPPAFSHFPTLSSHCSPPAHSLYCIAPRGSSPVECEHEKGGEDCKMKRFPAPLLLSTRTPPPVNKWWFKLFNTLKMCYSI